MLFRNLEVNSPINRWELKLVALEKGVALEDSEANIFSVTDSTIDI